jgi:hypothetical protein
MKINAGLAFTAEYSLSDYSADDGYAVSIRLVNASAVTDSVSLSGSGTTWTLTIPSATTTGYAAGTYTAQLMATLDGETYLVREMPATVVAAGAADLRTENQIVLDQLNTVIRTKSTQDYASLSIDGRSITRMGWDEILKARDEFQRRVNAEQRVANGGARVRTIKTRFTNA